MIKARAFNKGSPDNAILKVFVVIPWTPKKKMGEVLIEKMNIMWCSNPEDWCWEYQMNNIEGWVAYKPKEKRNET
jgi:hypothetical protein